MRTILDSEKLASGLNRVGLRSGGAVDIGSNALAETWLSDYAELYVVDADTFDSAAMPMLLNKLDSVIAKRLREQRDAGRFIDAHVCIIVSDTLIRGGQLAKESEASRYVSRKYWIDRSAPVEDILRRLTLTWVDVEATGSGPVPQFFEEFSDLRERISNRMGSGAASDFIEVNVE